MSDPFEQLEICCTEFTAASARVLARLPRKSHSTNTRLSGTIAGPWRDDAYTLTATYSFSPCSASEDSLLAVAIVLDPCSWTEETPFTYTVNLEIRDDEQLIASKTLLVELRSTGNAPLQQWNSDHQNQWPTPNR